MTEWGKVGDQMRHYLDARMPKRCVDVLEAAVKSTKRKDRLCIKRSHYRGPEEEVAHLNFPLNGTSFQMFFKNLTR